MLSARLREMFMADPGALAKRRALYRRLVRANIASVIENAFPVAHSMVGGAEFGQWLDRFLDQCGPTTPLYRDIPGDFVDWARVAALPNADLLQYEWMELVAARHPADLEAIAKRLGPAESMVNPTMQIQSFSRPVHCLSAESPSLKPFAVPQTYLVWRTPIEDQVVFEKVGPLLGRLVQAARDGEIQLSDLTSVAVDCVPEPNRAMVRAQLTEGCRSLGRRSGVLKGAGLLEHCP
jgi:uncharacterized protein